MIGLLRAEIGHHLGLMRNLEIQRKNPEHFLRSILKVRDMPRKHLAFKSELHLLDLHLSVSFFLPCYLLALSLYYLSPDHTLSLMGAVPSL